MISVKYALVIVAAFVAGASIFASPVPQAIAAVIATDVQCAGCVGASDLASSAVTTTKLASNSVNGGKVTDQSLSAADLGPDSVGASEIKGISKLIFAQCTPPSGQTVPGGGYTTITCSVPGVDGDDFALAQNTHLGGIQLDIYKADTGSNSVILLVHNFGGDQLIATNPIGLVIWDN